MHFLLVLTASLFPLFTLSYLWQLKEWRLDRLEEHLSTENFLQQLFGIGRPLIVLAGIITALTRIISVSDAVTGTLLALIAFGILKIVLKKQSYPVWTKKTLILLGLSLLFVGLDAGFLLYWLPNWVLLILLIPLLQPLYLLAAWLVFTPVDRFFKQKIMQRARALRNQYPNLKVIGITGSVGKTTTKTLLAHILASNQPLVTPAFVNSELGVANWLIANLPKIDKDKEQLVIAEMGAYATGEITTLSKIIQPQIGIITFIGSQHIALFGSQETILQAKSELFKCLPADGLAIINGDSPYSDELKEAAPCQTITVSTGGHSDIEAFDIEETSQGIAFRIQDTKFSVPIPGTHNVSNVLLAVALAQYLKIDLSTIAGKLKTFKLPSQTFNVKEMSGVTVLDDTHNASEHSAKAAITWAKSQPQEQKILLTSGLIELGDSSQSIHEKLGGLAAGVFDRVIFTHAKRAEQFKTGYLKPIDVLNRKTEPVPKGSLLICEGRVSQKIIQSLLPHK